MSLKPETVHKSDMNALIDLVLLTCNGINVTKDFVRLFYQNTPKGLINLVVLDNGSTDGTKEFLLEESKKHDNVTLAFSDTNLGIITGRNEGFNLCKDMKSKGLYVLFLDNDQFVQSGWLESHIDCMAQGYDMIGIEAWQMNSRFIPILKIIDPKQHYTYVGCGGMLIKKRVIDKIGMFDEQFNPCYFEDPDFCWRAYREGFKIGWNPKSKIVHMPHQTLGKLDHAEKTKRFATSLLRFREKWKDFTPPRMMLAE